MVIVYSRFRILVFILEQSNRRFWNRDVWGNIRKLVEYFDQLKSNVDKYIVDFREYIKIDNFINIEN